MIGPAVAFIFWPTCQRQKYNSINFGTEILGLAAPRGKHYAVTLSTSYLHEVKSAIRLLRL